MGKRLMRATVTKQVTVYFLADTTRDIDAQAKEYAKREEEDGDGAKVVGVEAVPVAKGDSIDVLWRGAYAWGADDDMTVEQARERHGV